MTPTTPAGCGVMLRYVETHANLRGEASESQLFSSWFEPIKDPAAHLARAHRHRARAGPRLTSACDAHRIVGMFTFHGWKR